MRLRLVGLVLLLTSAAYATTVRPPSFAELVGSADAVIQGEVTATRTELRDSGGRRVPFTVVTVRVERALVGAEVPAQLELVLLGGTVEGAGLQVVGQPTFAVGDRDVLFVQGNGRQLSPLVAMGHGRYLVVDDDSGRPVIARSNGAPLTALDGVSQPLEPADRTGSSGAGGRSPASAALSLETFAQQIVATARSLGRKDVATR